MTLKLAPWFLIGAAAFAQQQADHMVFFQKAIPPNAQAADAATRMFINIEDAGPALGGGLVTGAPFTADASSETVQVLGDGNRIVHKSTTALARDSKGRTRREESIGGIAPLAAAEVKKIIFIDDPVAQTHYILDPQSKTARKSVARHSSGGAVAISGGANSSSVTITTEAHSAAFVGEAGAMPPPPPGAVVVQHEVVHTMARPASGAAQGESLGARTIEGVEAEGTRTTTTIPAGTMGNERPISIVSERWYSRDLQTVVLSTRKDPRFGETTYRLTGINRSEPPATLFEVPPEYQITDRPMMMIHREAKEAK